MKRHEIEARIAAITGTSLSGPRIDALLGACGEYLAGKPHHTSATDLYPLIAVLAELLEPEPNGRLEDYAWLRSFGEPVPAAARRAGVCERHARERFEPLLREQAREDADAA